MSLHDPQAPHRAYNPLGRVPTLVTAAHDALNENTALLPFLADLAPEAGLLAPAGTVTRAHTQAWVEQRPRGFAQGVLAAYHFVP